MYLSVVEFSPAESLTPTFTARLACRENMLKPICSMSDREP